MLTMLATLDALENTNTRIIYGYDFTPIENNVSLTQYTKSSEHYFLSNEDKCISIKKINH